MNTAGSKAAAFVRSVALLGLFVVAVPWALAAAALARFGGRAPLHGVPAPADWDAGRVRAALTERLSDETVADIVIRLALIVAWVAVAVLVVTVVAEIIHMARHDGLPLPDVRGLTLSQPAARVIAVGLLAVLPMLTGSSRSTARSAPIGVPGEPSSAPVAHVDPATSSGHRPIATARVAAPGVGDPGPRSDPPDPPAAATSRRASSRYVVRAGDSVYGIAAQAVGPDPVAVADYAQRILDLNLGRTMGDGERFTNAAYIDVGWVLALPAGLDDVGPDPPPDSETVDVHTVSPGESLWSIAEDELGDPARWPELFEVNRDRTFADGRTLHDPSLIQPGWDLRLPAGHGKAGDTDHTGPVGHAGAADTPPVAAPAVAPDRTGPVVDRSSPSRSARAGPDDVAGRRGSEPSPDARPVNVWVRSDAPAPPASAGVPAADLVGDDVLDDDVLDDDGDVGADAADGFDAAADEATGERTQLLGMGGAAMLSAGVLTLLAVRRRTRLRRARPRVFLPEPGRGPAATERVLRAIDAGGRFARVDVAIRAAALPLIEREARVVAVVVGADGGLDLHASGPVRLPAPWEGDGSDVWHLAGSVPLELLAPDARRVAAPTPTLVQLGRTPDGRDVYVDLEAVEALEVGGSAEQADAVVAAVAATLAGSVLAEVTTLVGVGVPDDAFLGHRHHIGVRDPTLALRAAADAIGSTATQTRSTFELRSLVTAGETWEPAVVLAGSVTGTIVPPRSRTGLAIVSAAPIHGPSSRLAPDGDAWELRPAGIRMVPVGLDPHAIAAIAELVRVPDPVAPTAPDPPPSGSPASILDLADDRTLAPIDDLDGSAEPWARPASSEPTGTAATAAAPGSAGNDRRTEAAAPATPDPVDATADGDGRSDDGPPAAADPVDATAEGDGRTEAAVPTGPNPADADAVGDRRTDPATVPPRPDSGPPVPPWTLLVRLLGPVAVVDADGRAVAFERSKTRELVAWLATHRDRSGRIAARTALWELDVRDATFANVVSEARRALARLVEPPAGEEWVGRTMTDALPLHERVRTDADLVEHALDAARLQPPAQAIETLRPAVDLIGGVPFEGTLYLWPDAEGITSHLVLLATSATTELAAHCLSVGDIEGVFRATSRGLRVLPGHEELIGLRMRAHARAGDHAGVRQEWESYERVITADPWSDGEPAPKLVELRRRLLNPSG